MSRNIARPTLVSLSLSTIKHNIELIVLSALFIGILFPYTVHAAKSELNENSLCHWSELSEIPDSIGLGGPFVGLHNNA